MTAKLASGTRARAVLDWRGRTPDAKVPLHVQLRILERQGGKCAITGHKFKPGDKKRLDHKVPEADGGENRESNLQWILEGAHKSKTAEEAAVRAAVRAKAKAHASIKAEPTRPLQGRPFPETEKAQKRPPKLAVPSHLPNELERRYGIRPQPRGRKP